MTPFSAQNAAQSRIDWSFGPEQHNAARRLWQAHHDALDRRDMEGLLSTLTPECRCEVVPFGQRWTGHSGARAFYTSLLGAFPDMRLALEHIVIGAQGVFEVAQLVGTHQGVWAGIAPMQRAIRLRVLIYYPWNPEQQLFEGETVYFDRGEIDELLLT